MNIIHGLKLNAKMLFPKFIFICIRRIYRKLRYYISMHKYGGNAVLCPCCAGEFNRFIDYYDSCLNSYRNKVCPNCSSLPRHRIQAYYFTENRQNLPTDKILIFAEDSVAVWLDTNNLYYTSADLFNKYADLKIDIQHMPFHDKAWSLIIVNHVLVLVQDYKKALKEIRRVLTDDGVFVLTDATDRSSATTFEKTASDTQREWVEKFGHIRHLRIFGDDFTEILAASGFSVEIVDGNDLPAAIGGEVGPADWDDNRVYICRKK